MYGPGPEPPVGDRQALLDFWHGQLTEAREKYSLTATRCKTVSRDFIEGALPTPDGGANMVAALKAEARARNEYMRILRIFTDLVVGGKRPGE